VAFDVVNLGMILDKQNSLIEELRNLASEQLQALKHDDLNKIINITSHQEYVGRQLAVLEQQRQVIMDKFGQEHGIEIDNFRDLEPHTSSEEFSEIQKSRDKIINGCQKLKEEHGLNALLLKQGLKYAEGILRVFNSKKSLVYGKSGDIRSAGTIGIFDANA
jgi:flagellar biosynthesis/type III secretory pathway chaperone